jgi:outer membrane immunogenic protein
MKKLITLSLIAFGMAATPAFAQDSEQKVETYVGVTGGYHDIGVGVPRDNGGIFGAVAGVDVPLGGKLVIGLEGNFNIGTGAIDSEYGVATKLGVNVSDKAQLYVRGGYQEINFDLAHVAGGPVPAGLDDTDGDYLVGLGGRFKLNDSVALRLNADTISFDSTRLTAGVQFHF